MYPYDSMRQRSGLRHGFHRIFYQVGSVQQTKTCDRVAPAQLISPPSVDITRSAACAPLSKRPRLA